MKSGFEENVPKVRPRVRLGRALDEQLAEAREVAAAESAVPPVAPAVHELSAVAEAADPAPEPERAPVQQLLPQAFAEVPRREAAPRRRAASTTANEVADLARELTSELQRATEANARLKFDLDAALTSLRQAADESRDQRDETTRLTVEIEKRGAAARELLGELELLEAERDGALAQVARLTRELREEKARSVVAADGVQRARAETQEARDAAQRLIAELQERTRERDELRQELIAARADRDSLADELLAARSDADEAAQSRSALEEIHRALAEARSRIGR